jgi:ADP-heptose:LPS heptosyltransferase
MIPALRAIRERYPDCLLHALVPAEAGPLLEHLPWLTRLWPVPRQRGRARFQQIWPIVRALRAERFDRSVDFGSNDRGAILSLLCGARERLGVVNPGGFLGRRFCYTRRQSPAPEDRHESQRLLDILSAWDIFSASSLETEIHTAPAQDARAESILHGKKIICHIASSQPKKEWPLSHWATLHEMTTAAGHSMVFSSGTGPREQKLLQDLQRLIPGAATLPPDLDRALFLSVIKRARLFISNDTAPLHYAAGVGVPTVSLFGPTAAARWGPIGHRHQAIQGSACACDPECAVCSSAISCMAGISPAAVFALVGRSASFQL